MVGRSRYALAAPVAPVGYKLDRKRVPRIPDVLMDGAAFMYRTVDEANARARLGGSAFLVGRELVGSKELFGRARWLPYLVSNRHVVHSGSACVASVNRKQGGAPDVWDIDQNDWVAHPDADLAVTCAIDFINDQVHRLSYVPEADLLTPEFIAASHLGVGEETIMVGRFVNHQGTVENRAAARFGNLSMMLEGVMVVDDFGNVRPEECFAVEMRSRTGFSGSPVAVYRTRSSTLAPVPEDYADFWRLLGINANYIVDDKLENTWLNGVVPAWKISEVMNLPPLRAIQQKHEDWIAGEIQKGNSQQP